MKAWKITVGRVSRKALRGALRPLSRFLLGPIHTEGGGGAKQPERKLPSPPFHFFLSIFHLTILYISLSLLSPFYRLSIFLSHLFSLSFLLQVAICSTSISQQGSPPTLRHGGEWACPGGLAVHHAHGAHGTYTEGGAYI